MNYTTVIKEVFNISRLFNSRDDYKCTFTPIPLPIRKKRKRKKVNPIIIRIPQIMLRNKYSNISYYDETYVSTYVPFTNKQINHLHNCRITFTPSRLYSQTMNHTRTNIKLGIIRHYKPIFNKPKSLPKRIKLKVSRYVPINSPIDDDMICCDNGHFVD